MVVFWRRECKTCLKLRHQYHHVPRFAFDLRHVLVTLFDEDLGKLRELARHFFEKLLEQVLVLATFHVLLPKLSGYARALIR
jgi:hypothetical protein